MLTLTLGSAIRTLTVDETQLRLYVGNTSNGTTTTTTTSNTTGNMGGTTGGNELFTPSNTAPANLAPNSIQPAGGSQPPENMMPFLVISFLVALEGIFPSQN